MGDLFIALSCLCLIVVLYLKFKNAGILKKLKKDLEDQLKKSDRVG
jgi:hypothetical protein